MAQHRRLLTDTYRGIHEPDFHLDIARGKVRRTTMRGGVREGVDLVEIDNGKFRFAVVPTRGMSLWKAWLGDTEIGWNSPVKGPGAPQLRACDRSRWTRLAGGVRRAFVPLRLVEQWRA
jgi:hypothetical protein